MPRSISTNRPMFASSSGASISSSRQNGLGLYLNRPNISAIAVSAFSPPDSSCTLCRRLPGGCGDDLDAALERIVFVEQRQAGAAAAEQRAERLLEVRVDGGERLGEALPRRLVDALDRFAGLRDRVDEVLALRREERVARLELVELLDRHHVHRAEPIDLRRAARAIASSALSARCSAASTAVPGSVRSA